MVDKITNIEELEKVREAAATQNMAVPNYQEWSSVMMQLEEAGVKSTGSYEGDKAKLQEVEATITKFMNEVQNEQMAKQRTDENKAIKETAETDKNQGIKATVANATSSMILSDYMKYYHLL